MTKHIQDQTQFNAEGFIKIIDPDTNYCILEKHNAINFQNFSAYITESIYADSIQLEMAFGNQGVQIDSIGSITYRPTNTSNANDELYNEIYSKVITNSSNVDENNFITSNMIHGNNFIDLVITATLGYNEPVGQPEYDNNESVDGDFIINELGLKRSTGEFLTHVVFHPIQKSANRRIQVIYTIRTTIGS